MLRVRWLGRVTYQDAHALQHGLFARSADDHLLLLEHPHVFTLGPRGSLDHLLVDAAAVGAEVVPTDRGGDITYHGPGQLVGYPILTVPGKRGGGMADTVAYVHSVEQLLIDVLADLGLTDVGRIDGLAGVWVAPASDRPRKVAAIGVKLSRGRSMHGFALNVDPDLGWFDRIVPCGITDKGVTSLRAEGLDVDLPTVVDAVVARAVERWGAGGWDRADVKALPSEVPVKVGGLAIAERKPEWLRAKIELGSDYRALRKRMRRLDLVTVCEEAGCPNISECWADGTATFMLNGERCTRACGFCLVDTRKPDAPPAVDEPERVADAVAEMGLRFAVLTAVARDDLPDGGAGQFAATIEAIRRRSPGTEVEVLIPDCKGDARSLDVIFGARPDVLNHNLETVARLQRAVRPSAGYARSLSVLAPAAAAGLTTKSGMILGLGETEDEVVQALADLAAVGTDIVTLGQYLRPTAAHLPVRRWWTPEEFDDLKAAGEALGLRHVEAGPLVRSSYHAPRGVDGLEPDQRVSAFADRVARVRAEMGRHGVDVALLSVGADLPWLTGYEAMPLERLTMLVLPREGEATLVVPRLEAPRVVERPEVFSIQPWEETQDPVELVGRLAGRPDVVAIGDRTWGRFVLDLQAQLPGARFRPTQPLLGPLRAVKDPAEVASLRRAGSTVDRVVGQIQAGEVPLGGRTEAEVAADVHARLLEAGHHQVNFVIVASGPNAASPHHEPGGRRIEVGEGVLFDIGGTVLDADGVGYCSDITRCVHLGPPPAELRDLYAVLQDAQAQAVEAAVVGTPCEDVDAVARRLITEGGYGDEFVHRTGHGIGIEAHEDPYVVAGNCEALVPGHAFSVEPGIYVEGRWGARIEDIVVATDAGPEPLNLVPHELIEL